MFVRDAQEANTIVQGVLKNLSTCIPQSGAVGVQARTAIGDLQANAFVLLRQDAIGPSLQNCFDLVVQTGATQPQIDWVRQEAEGITTPITVGGTLMQNSCINFCLAAQADIISAMTFTSYQDVIAVIENLRTPFGDAIEIAADEMDQMTFQALLALAANLTNYLITTARPLPRLVTYQFASVLPTLVIAYRLYADASRCDQVRQENKIIHPAFCPLNGVALSS